ncbi:MAG: efflux RND transporter permease subunit [Planctomycetota bacterium]|nr:efflux RND transporter permease subunit [Planctomycetota bacterium]
MDPIKFSIARPVTVAVGVILIVMFGLIGLGAIPIQLTPTIDRPVVTVATSWPGRSPEEVVDEITKEQEEQLKNVPNLKTMRSVSREGEATITLEFYVGTSPATARQDVSDALRQVPDYPEEVDEPRIESADGSPDQAIAWIIIDLDPAVKAQHPDFDISTLFTPLDREVKPFLERVDGVAEVNIYGGREQEVRVLLDPVALAQRMVSHREVIAALRQENTNVSAGTIAEGKRDYRVRVVGQFASGEDVLDTIVAYRPPASDPDGLAVPVYVRDVGTVEIGHQKERGFVRSMGEPCLAMNVIRKTGSNVMSVMEGVRGRLEEIRTDFLPRIHPEVGPHLRMRQVYDETTYIDSSIDLVLSNLWAAAGLTTLSLLLFLRSVKSTLIIVLSIPISILGTFLIMLAFGRTLNVISLAGLAFATGVVVDNANVVLENIDRRRSLGEPPLTAIYRGSMEVWGAILIATLTNVAVFVPVLTVQEEAGQIFFDLTLALAASTLLSLLVAVTVVPSLSAVLFKGDNAREVKAHAGNGIMGLFGLARLMGAMVNSLSRVIYWCMTGWRGWTIRPAVVLVFTAASLLGARYLAPPLDYLPAGNRNLVFGGLLIPPGLSMETQRSYSQHIESLVGPYIEKDTTDPAVRATLPPVMRFDDPAHPFDPVGVENFFIGAFQGGMFVGGTSMEPQKVIPVGALLTGTMNTIPATFGGAQQASIFGFGIGSGNTINLEISGPSLPRVVDAAQMAFMTAAMKYGFGNVRPDPANFNLTQPEWRVRVTDAGRELGLRTEDVGTAVRGLFDGAFAGDYILDGRKVDLMVLPRGESGEGRLRYKEELASVPVVTPVGKIVPIDSIVRIEPGTAPQEISRIEELPSVAIQITPPSGVPLETVMEELRSQVIEPGRQAGLIDRTMRVRLEGTAAKLDEVRAALFGRADADGPRSAWQTGLMAVAGLIFLGGMALAVRSLLKAASAHRRARAARGSSRSLYFYGAVGGLLLGVVLGGVLLGVAVAPQLVMARFVWALLVTYLLMAALFESFLYPLVILISVPLGIVGGFLALRIVHEWTLMNPTIAPQQLDVLTMIGFIILIGTVVNNAILLVEQALNFMHPEKVSGLEDQDPLPPLKAIAESVRTRVRPIFMTTLTTLVGGLPLVVAPGAGSEMYRGLGAVVIGGLFVSTIFTLVLVPLLFSMVLQMREGVFAVLFGEKDAPPGSDSDLSAVEDGAAPAERVRQGRLQPA